MGISKKTGFIIAGMALATIYLMSSKSSKAFAAPTADNKQRGCDPKGCGHFGAPRSDRKHGGIDFKAVPGQNILAPISGTVTKHPRPYSNDMTYKGIEIVNAHYKVQMFYLVPTAAIGSSVKAGQKIGTAQNISAKHGADMTNHVHFEVYDRRTGKLIDPTEMFGISLNYDLLLKKGMYNLLEVKKLQEFLDIKPDGDFGQMTEDALQAQKGVKQITLNAF